MLQKEYKGHFLALILQLMLHHIVFFFGFVAECFMYILS